MDEELKNYQEFKDYELAAEALSKMQEKVFSLDELEALRKAR